MERHKILIISDSINQGVQISQMLPLTRFDDKINVIICSEIESYESVCSPKLVILDTRKDNIIDTLKEIKQSPLLRTSKLLLLLEDNDDDILCSAYDIGIDNFLIGYDETTLFLLVLSILKSCSGASTSERYALMRDILIDKNFIDVYMVYSYAEMGETLSAFIEERNFDFNILMFAPSIEAEENVSKHMMSATLIDSIRSDDIPVYVQGKTFAIIFKTVDETRIKLFFEKLKVKYESLCSLYGVSSKIENSAEFTFLYLQKILEENRKSGQEYAYFQDLSDVKYLGDFDSGNKDEDYMKSKNKFWKSFSELITPYFFRTKTVMESKFPDSEINDSINEEETFFSISQDSLRAELKITYPAYSRINVVISFERNGENKSHKEFYEINDFNELVLDELFMELFNGYEILMHSENNE